MSSAPPAMATGSERRDPAERPVAIVTGASSGIGQATAIMLAARGFDLGITFRSNAAGAQDAQAAVAAHGGRAVVERLDMRDGREIAPTLGRLADALGRVDVLVNNGGMYRQTDELEDWADMFAVHVTGPWVAAQAVAPRMRAAGRGGRIINVTSILATESQAGAAAYCAAKAALEMVTRVLALELAPDRILVNAVAPGNIATPASFGDAVPDAMTFERPVIPLRRPGAADEIASAIAFLASADSSYVTGASLLVDGGLKLVSGAQTLQEAVGVPESRDGP